MDDVVTNEVGAEAPVEQAFIAKIPLKSDCGEVEVNFDQLPIEVYKMLLIEGAKAIINSVGMSKKLPGISKLEGTDKEKAVAEVRKQAEANVVAMLNGTISKGRAKGAKVSGAEQTEAMRLAKLLVKDHIRANGQKIGAYSAKEITAAAKTVLESNPGILEQARKNIAERAGDAGNAKGLDLTKLFGAKASSDEVKAKPKVPPKAPAKGAKAEKAKAAAGVVAPRAKPEAHSTKH